MLVLTRKTEDRIWISPDITVAVLSIGRDGVRIGIEAPADTLILREELTRRPGFDLGSVSRDGCRGRAEVWPGWSEARVLAALRGLGDAGAAAVRGLAEGAEATNTGG